MWRIGVRVHLDHVRHGEGRACCCDRYRAAFKGALGINLDGLEGTGDARPGDWLAMRTRAVAQVVERVRRWADEQIRGEGETEQHALGVREEVFDG